MTLRHIGRGYRSLSVQPISNSVALILHWVWLHALLRNSNFTAGERRGLDTSRLISLHMRIEEMGGARDDARHHLLVKVGAPLTLSS